MDAVILVALGQLRLRTHTMVVRIISLLIAAILVTAFPADAADLTARAIRIDVGGFKMNSVLLKSGKNADLPPIVFIHGASTSLLDPMLSFRQRLEGRATLLFVDRPGHGRSDTGGDKTLLPDAQADAISVLMKKRAMKRAIIVSHSFGGAVAAALAVRHPDQVLGLVFLSPAVYPWSGGVSWYYEAARPPITGVLFSTLIVPPIGLFTVDRATKEVFAPNRPPMHYVRDTKARDAIKPLTFRRNAREIGALSDWAKNASKDYRKIKVPTVIITGDADQIVSPAVHSKHLARDIEGSELVVVHRLGHKSDYIASDLAIAAIEKVAGKGLMLRLQAKSVERAILSDVR